MSGEPILLLCKEVLMGLNCGMHVALDTNGIYTSQAGVSRYIKGLIKGFRRLAHPDLDFFELAWPVENFEYAQPKRAIKTAYRELFWAKFVAPKILKQMAPDLLHSNATCMISPPEKMKHVVSIMDASFLRQPDRFRKWQGWSWKRSLRHLPGAERILCISQFTADELARLLGFPAAKMEVVYLGSEFHPEEPEPREETPSFEVPAEFFLFVGSLEPGKNLALLKEAYLLAERRKILLPPLMIMGARWEGVAHEGPPPPNWHYLGRQPDSILVHLYRRALALVFPSKYEGFGLPLVEAMALGCPVICSPVASLPEVAGEAAYLIPLETEAYLDAMRGVAGDGSLREELRGKGRIQSGKFSWKRCAEETCEIYRQVLC
jgi:glycosyltransferase involved in cell wall biosynthesis